MLTSLAGWLAVVQAQSGHASKALQGYRERYLGCFSGDALQGLRVGLYQHSSVARDFLAELLPQLGAEVILIGRSDQFVPIDTEAVSSDDQRQFADWCRDYALDALVSTDGDADRPLLCDGHGNFIPGDQLGMMTAHYLGIKTAVAPVSCTSALESSGWFSMVQRTRIGSPFVIAAMQALSAVEGAVAGFEANGGFLLGTDIVLGGRIMTALPTRDSLLPILCTLVASRGGEGTLADCVARLPQRFTRADRIRSVPAAVSTDLLARCADEAASMWRDSFMSGIGRVVQVDQTDGVRMTLEQGGIVHFRASGNAPELRCYVEAGAVAEAEALLAVCMERLRAHVAAV
jgi:phosphomannomutase